MASFKNNFLTGQSKVQLIEFGLVTILMVNILSIWFPLEKLGTITMVLCLVTILTPTVLRPFSALWYRLSETLSTLGSTVMLGAVFFLIVTPIGLLRKLAGKDSLMLKQFKGGPGSVFKERNHVYGPDDLVNTF
ncbi:MAG: SxtJ family membrane protein [Flagellimonas sp.]